MKRKRNKNRKNKRRNKAKENGHRIVGGQDTEVIYVINIFGGVFFLLVFMLNLG